MHSSEPKRQRRAMAPAMVIWLLALLLGLQPVTTDLSLPALPQLTSALGASMAQAQLTLTALLLCFGFGQLVCGPLSDRYGRRPVLLGGMVLYTLAALGNTAATGIGWLIATRAVQGAALGAAVMCARAIVRDVFEPEQGARAMTKDLGGLGVLALLAPLVGGLLTPWFGWRVVLAVMALCGALLLALLAICFEETAPHHQPKSLAQHAKNWAGIVRHRGFLAWAVLQAASYGGLFTFLAASSFVFLNVYGMSRPLYGLAMASASLAYIAGTVLCRRLLQRRGLRGAERIGAWISLAGGTAIGLLGLAGLHTWWAFLLPYWVFMVGHGIHQPSAQTGAVAEFPHAAGAASALSGFLLTLVAFGVGAWLGQRLDGTVLPLTNGIWLWSCVIAFFGLFLVQRYGEVSPTAASELVIPA